MVQDITRSSFPMTFSDFERGSQGYMIGGIGGYHLHEIVPIDVLFVQLDLDANGLLTHLEFSNLPVLLGDAEKAADKLTAEAEARMLESAWQRRLQDSVLSYREPNPAANPDIEAKVCKADGDRIYCPLDMTCKPPGDCSTCGWKTAVDFEESTCVQPSTIACKNDNGKTFCPTDMSCHPPGNCSNCPSMSIADHAQHKCLEPWWEEKPRDTWTSWICRHRKKVGMTCVNDMDCLYGTRRCLLGKCQSLQPYNSEHTCSEDLDCPHVGYYCPTDPTFGEDPYFVQFCRRQRESGDKCSVDRECEPGTVCNDVERPKRCRGFFSIPTWTDECGDNCKAKDPNLCVTGWTDKFDRCTVPAKSKSFGRSSGKDSDCETTDQTGKSGNCTCKAWWDGGEPKYCLPVFGDMINEGERVRDWIYFKKENCGNFWSDDECVEEFGEDARCLLKKLNCEVQTLSNGPYLPPPGCADLRTQDRYENHCECSSEADNNCLEDMCDES
jgi:hypothetical protein